MSSSTRRGIKTRMTVPAFPSCCLACGPRPMSKTQSFARHPAAAALGWPGDHPHATTSGDNRCRSPTAGTPPSNDRHGWRQLRSRSGLRRAADLFTTTVLWAGAAPANRPVTKAFSRGRSAIAPGVTYCTMRTILRRPSPPAPSVMRILSKTTRACSTRSPSTTMALRAASNRTAVLPDSQTLSPAEIPSENVNRR